MPTHNELLRLGQSVLAAQPFSMWLGVRLSVLVPGEAELRLPLQREHLQGKSIVHGGVLGYLVDNASAFAGGSLLGPAAMTAEYKISFLRPASGTELIANARVVHAGRSQAVVQCDVHILTAASTPKLCAVGLATIARVTEARATPEEEA